MKEPVQHEKSGFAAEIFLETSLAFPGDLGAKSEIAEIPGETLGNQPLLGRKGDHVRRVILSAKIPVQN
jgi:hypothetical protein